jgi:ligand-binding sensor domain-containing protein
MIALTVDKNNTIWGGGGIMSLIGLYKFDGNSWTLYDTTNSGLPYPFVAQVTSDVNGKVWGLAVSSGVQALFSFDGNYWRKYNCPYRSFWLSTTVADKKGNIWFATDQPSEGIVQFNGLGFIFHPKPDPSLSFPTKLITDKLDNLWVCWETGIAEFSNNTWHVYKDTLNHDFSGMVVDKFNNLWLSTFRSGVVAFNKSGLLLSNNDIYPTPVADIFNLFQNYPNPFNPSTKIRWQSPVSSWQTIKVYDVLGNEVVTLVDEFKPAGNYEVEFNAVETLHAMSLPSGVYFYQLKAGDYIGTKKMILLR